MNLARPTLAVTIAAALAGCGGGGAEDFSNRPRIRVRWPALGRSIQASAYANSLRIVLPNARLSPKEVGGVLQTDVVIEANRPSDAESEVDYRIPEPIKSGKTQLIIDTFSQANQQGRRLQTTTESVVVGAEGYFADIALKPGPDAAKGINLALIGSFSPPYNEGDPVFSVYVGDSPGLAVGIAELFQIEPKYYDDIRWTFEYSENPAGAAIEGVPFKNVNNSYFSVKTIRPGLVTVRASIDGIVSNPAVFRVIPRP